MPRLEIGVNQVCSAACQYCNRAIGLAKFANMTMTAAQIRTAVDIIIEQGHKVPRVTLGGGEPLLNKELQGIVDECDRLPGLKLGRILTNDLERDTVRKMLKLPRRWKWIPAPLDDPTDPYSGKDKHEPFFVSPHDHGIHSTWDDCSVRGYCGKGLDAYGFSMCGVAVSIGRLIGVDPYWQDGIQVYRKQEEICKHCVYGMPRKENQKLMARVHSGELKAISPTFKEGLKRHREQPMEFNRFGQQLHQIG